MAGRRSTWKTATGFDGGCGKGCGGVTADLIDWANESSTPVLSLDIPSGVESTTGDTPGSVIRPNKTLTLALPKTGLTASNVGEVILADIGIPAGVYRRMDLVYESPFDSRYGVPISTPSKEFSR